MTTSETLVSLTSKYTCYTKPLFSLHLEEKQLSLVCKFCY